MRYLKMIKFKPSMNDIVVYLCAVMLTVIAFLVFYLNYFEHILNEMSSLARCKSELTECLNQKQINFTAMEENKAALEELKKSAAPRSISSNDETEAVLYILNLISEHRLTESNFKILTRENSNGYLREIRYLRPIQFDVSGGYYDCMRFLYDIQHGKYYFLPGKIEISSYDAENIRMTLFVYIIIEDTANGGDMFETDIKNPIKDDEYAGNPFFYE